MPGVVLGIGYLRTFYGVQLPDGTPLAAFWLMIVLALAVRRLPYALRACNAALQQISVSLEEAAENLGASKQAHGAAHRRAADGGRHPRRLRHQLHDRRGRALGDADAGADRTSDAPLAYGIYVYMQSPAGAGPARRSA